MTDREKEADELRRYFEKIPTSSEDTGPTPDPDRVLEQIEEGVEAFKEVLNNIHPT